MFMCLDLLHMQCSAAGAAFCYLLSSLVGHKIVNRYFPERLRNWKKQVCINCSSHTLKIWRGKGRGGGGDKGGVK